ncbi:MAG: hypothetical protein WEA24_02725 [Gemmatimonadota bacterium]
MKRRFAAVEHGLVSSETPVSNAAWDRLMRSAARLPGDFLRRTGRGVVVGGYVGVVDLGWCQLEILPKGTAELSADDLRRFLFDLLDRAGLVPRPLISRTAVASGRHHLLQVLISSFSSQLHRDLLLGVPRRYHIREERLSQIKGKIRFSALATSLPSERHVTPIRHAPLQFDNGLNRVLRALGTALRDAAESRQDIMTLDHCDRMLGAARIISLHHLRPHRVRLSRQEDRWRPYVDLAVLIRRGQAPIPTSTGEAKGFGLLFTLDDVFERLIRRTLASSPPLGTKLSLRPVRPRLLHSVSTGVASLSLRPDLLLTDGGGHPILVADAKWKQLPSRSGSHGLSPTDVYQVATYMAAHSVDRGLLLFPEAAWMREGGRSSWRNRFRLAGGQGELTVGSVDVFGLASGDSQRRAHAVERLHELVLAASQPAVDGLV